MKTTYWTDFELLLERFADDNLKPTLDEYKQTLYNLEEDEADAFDRAEAEDTDEAVAAAEAAVKARREMEWAVTDLENLIDTLYKAVDYVNAVKEYCPQMIKDAGLE